MTFKPLPPPSRVVLQILAVCLAVRFQTIAQTQFSDSSLLRQTAYVKEAIQDISDAQLWSALDLQRPGLERVHDRVQAGDLARAAVRWDEYWRSRKQPGYVTAMDHLVIDTDLLMTGASFQDAMRGAPEERDTILARAQQLLGNRITTWGNNIIDFGDRVDFNRDMGQSEKYGFHYWIWARPLMMAAVLTGEEKYLAKFDELFNRWYEQRNSITRGFSNLDVVYYELGLGFRNRIFIEDYLFPFPGRTAKTSVRMLKTFLGAGRWLYQMEKWEGYRAGNWQIHGAYMLTQLALVFPEFRESREWRRVGLQRMLEHLDRDFFPDGGHSERSPRNYTMSTYLTYRNLAYLLSVYDVEPEAARRIRTFMGRTLDWWESILTPTGEIPAINDSYRGLFPERILLDGETFFGHTPSLALREGSRHMPESGFTVMRSDSSANALYLLVQYGPFAGFHTHFDLLDFELYAFGKALAVDAGVGTTYDDPLYPDWYRSSRAHNMVAVNDSNIEREGFRGENIQWGSTTSVDYFSGEQNGYRRFGVWQQRQIVFVKPFYWFVLDDLDCARSGDTLSWYFHSPTSLLPSGAGFASSSAPGVQIIPVGVPCSTRSGRGVAASSTIKVPGKTEEINWVRFDRLSTAGARTQFPILLAPFQRPQDAPVTARLSAQHYLVERAGTSDHLYFTHGPYKDTTIQTDASFVLLRKTRDGRVNFVVINGTYLNYGTTTVWSSASPRSGEGQLP